MARIFISYRRADSAPYAGRLYDRLRQHFGEADVFMDLEAIAPGAEFAQVIVQKAGAAQVLVALIGRGWLNATDALGVRRLDDPNDLVVREIETALAHNLRVIPVLMGGAAMPTSEQLPARIAALAGRNAIDISDQRFHADVDRLIKVIDQTAPASGARRALRWLAMGGAVTALFAGLWLMLGRTPPVSNNLEVEHAARGPAPAGASGAAVGEQPRAWDQLRALPVLYSESFDPVNVLDIWKPGSPRPPWSEALTNGRYCVVNDTSETAVHFIHVGVDQRNPQDAPVSVKMQPSASGTLPFAGGGLLYRFDDASRTYYAFLLSSTGQASLWRRDETGLIKLYAGAAPRVRADEPVLLGMAANGARISLYVNETLLATVEDSRLRGGKTGVVAMGKGRYCFDDFEVRGEVAGSPVNTLKK